MELHSKIHLYETAHSGFYSDDPTRTVNLVPKTWTKFTVTDGDWKTNKTLEPLWNRDIFLANEIDKVDKDKRNHYKAGDHFFIDHENKLMDVSPFNYLFEFGGGILYNPDTKYIYTDIKQRPGELPNRLIIDNGVTYDCKVIPPEERFKHFVDSAHCNPPQLNFSAFINDEQFNDNNYSACMSGATIIAVSGNYFTEGDVYSGYWRSSSADCWSEELQKRYKGPLPGWNYSAEHPDEYEKIIHKEIEPTTINYFDPTDRTITVSSETEFIAGSNYISGNYDMCPTGVFYIWD